MSGLEEGLGGHERLDPEADRCQEIPDGSAERSVVVHDGNQPYAILAHELSSVPRSRYRSTTRLGREPEGVLPDLVGSAAGCGNRGVTCRLPRLVAGIR
jgi:hypothetical protein